MGQLCILLSGLRGDCPKGERFFSPPRSMLLALLVGHTLSAGLSLLVFWLNCVPFFF